MKYPFIFSSFVNQHDFCYWLSFRFTSFPSSTLFLKPNHCTAIAEKLHQRLGICGHQSALMKIGFQHGIEQHGVVRRRLCSKERVSHVLNTNLSKKSLPHDPSVLTNGARAVHRSAFVGASCLLLLPGDVLVSTPTATDDCFEFFVVEGVVLFLQHLREPRLSDDRLVAHAPHDGSLGQDLVRREEYVFPQRRVGAQVEGGVPHTVQVLGRGARVRVTGRLDVATQRHILPTHRGGEETQGPKTLGRKHRARGGRTRRIDNSDVQECQRSCTSFFFTPLPGTMARGSSSRKRSSKRKNSATRFARRRSRNARRSSFRGAQEEEETYRGKHLEEVNKVLHKWFQRPEANGRCVVVRADVWSFVNNSRRVAFLIGGTVYNMYMTAFGGDVYVKRAPTLYDRKTTDDDSHFMRFIDELTTAYKDWRLEVQGNLAADDHSQVKIRFNNKDRRREDLMRTCKDFYHEMTKHSTFL